MASKSCTPVWSSVIFANIMALTAGSLSIIWIHITHFDHSIGEYANYSWDMEILYAVGGLFGSIISGLLAHKFGRKPTILLLGLLSILALLLFAIFEWKVKGLIAAQLFGGFATGGILVVLPVYIVEVAENRNRGRLAAMMNFFYCLGYIAMTLLIGLLAGAILIPCILSIIFVGISLAIIFFVIYETPQYLILTKQEEEAKKTLQNLRNTTHVDDEYSEIRDLALALSNTKAVLHAVALLVFRALSGTEVALAYSTAIRLQQDVIDEGYTFMFFVPLIASILSIYLMDTIGRKTILGVSTIGTVIAQIIIGIFIEQGLQEKYWLILLCVTMLRMFYSVGIATLPIIVAAELQAINKKPLILGTAASISWCITLFIQGFFFNIVEILGISVYWVFPVANVIAVIYYVVFLPETMKKGPKEISDSLKQRI